MNTTTYTKNDEQKAHYYWLDTIRFLAAFLVVICLYRAFFFAEYAQLPSSQQNIASMFFYFVTRFGEEAVLIFFVLSGFLVGGKSLYKARNGTFDIKGYSIDRIARIMLPLFSSLLILIPICYILDTQINWLTWLGNLLSLQGIFVQKAPYSEPLWSLSYEVWFYITIGSLLVYMKSDKKIFPALILLTCAFVFTKLDIKYMVIWIIGDLAFNYSIHKNTKILFITSTLLSIIILFSLQITRESHYINNNLPHIIYENRTFLMYLFAFSVSTFIVSVIKITPKNNIAIYI